MPTITLKIDHETLDALTRGAVVELTATLRARKPRAQAVLSPEQKALHERVAKLFEHHKPEVNVGRAWKAISKVQDDPQRVADALAVCLDWAEGVTYQPEWFVQDYEEWVARTQLDLMEAESWRDAWRRAKGVR